MIIRVRRGLEANRSSYTPALGEPTFTTDTKRLYVGDGVTPGGIPVDMGGGGGGGGSGIDFEHREDKSNPHEVTKAQVGLSNVPNIDLTPTISSMQTAINGKQPTGSYATTGQLSIGLAGKAESSHSHVMTDVAGLATALEGKQPVGDYATSSEVGAKGQVEAIVAGANVVVNNADPRNPVISAVATGEGGGGITEHGLLGGLDVDDHLQYHTDARGDARYYQKSEVDTQLSGKSPTSHNHDDLYSPLDHNHDSLYSPLAHNHDNRYYTEFEVDAALIGKADLSHTHPITDIQATGSSIASKYLRGDGTWSVPSNTTYTEITEAEITTGTASTLRTITGRRLKFFFDSIVAHIQANVFLWTHPVGSIFTTTDAVNPGETFGGAWAAFAEGTTIVGKAPSGTFATAGEVIGEEAHIHTLESGRADLGITGGNLVFRRLSEALSGNTRYDASGGTTNVVPSMAYKTALSGTTDSGSNVQPSVVAYIWRRTA